MDIEKQLGLGYLKGRRRTDQAVERPGVGNSSTLSIDALLTHGRPLLKELKRCGGRERLHPMLSTLQMQIAVALPVVEYLAGEGLVDIVDQDVTGNSLLQLTPRGELLLD